MSGKEESAGTRARRVSLVDVARELGDCEATSVDGIEVAGSFGNPPLEYAALRERAAVVDLSFRRRLSITGSDRESFLHAMLSNDVKNLRVGQGCHALLLTVQGKVVADCLALAEETGMILDTMAGRAGLLAEALERYVVADDVSVERIGERDCAIGVFGPLAGRVAAAAAEGIELPMAPQDRPYACWRATPGELALAVVSLPEPGCGGFLFTAAAEQAPLLWRRLVAASREQAGGGAAGLLAYDSLRIESGQPWCGIDFGEETIALEAGLERAISFTKGCYLGQEVIERVSSRGQVNRRLVGLKLAGRAGPEPGTKLLSGAKEVGWLTSVTHSYKLDSLLALGYVGREHLQPGTELGVAHEGVSRAVVTALPL